MAQRNKNPGKTSSLADIAKLLYTKEYYLDPRQCGGSAYIRGRIVDMLELNQDDVVLDVGCGKGDTLQLISGSIRKGVGIDFSDDAVSLAKKYLAKERNLAVYKADCTKSLKGRFTKILLEDVLEHLTEEEALQALNNLYNNLERGGVLVVHTSPNRLFITFIYPLVKLLFPTRITKKLEEKRKVHTAKVDFEHLHKNEFSYFSLKRLFARTTFDYEVILEKDVLRRGEYFITKDVPRWLTFLVRLVQFKPFLYLLSNDLYVVCRKRR
jgi:cyclopropane fatty-acyl-phospholipid synthase-like methyltransferase